MVVVYATQNDETPSSVSWWERGGGVSSTSSGHKSRTTTNGTVHAYSQLLYVDVMLVHPAVGAAEQSAEAIRMLQKNPDLLGPKKHHKQAAEAPLRPDGGPPDGVTYGIGDYSNPQMYYDSPMLHTVRLQGLRGGVTYTYVVAGDTREFAFTMPPDSTLDGVESFPFLLGLTADLGQTAASEVNVGLMRKQLHAFGEAVNSRRTRASGGLGDGHGRSVVLLAGDLSYADGWGPRWDSFGRMMEPLSSTYPVLTAPGNHEVAVGEAWVSYNARYPMPHSTSGSPSNLWWSRDVGPVHIISLCSYAGTAAGSLQHRWLLRDLKAINRQRTPWVVAMMHVPWYHSNSEHASEAGSMRRDMERCVRLRRCRYHCRYHCIPRDTSLAAEPPIVSSLVPCS